MIAFLLLVACRSGQVEVERELVYIRDTGTASDDSTAPDGDDSGHGTDTQDTGQAGDDTGAAGDTSTSEDSGDTGEPVGGEDSAVVDSGDSGDTAVVDEPAECDEGTTFTFTEASFSCDEGTWTAHWTFEGEYSELKVSFLGHHFEDYVYVELTDDSGCCESGRDPTTYADCDEETFHSLYMTGTAADGSHIQALAGPGNEGSVYTFAQIVPVTEMTCDPEL